jgi:hypothetical protein
VLGYREPERQLGNWGRRHFGARSFAADRSHCITPDPPGIFSGSKRRPIVCRCCHGSAAPNTAGSAIRRLVAGPASPWQVKGASSNAMTPAPIAANRKIRSGDRWRIQQTLEKPLGNRARHGLLDPAECGDRAAIARALRRLLDQIPPARWRTIGV